jgi:hypothetical protein
MIDLLAVYICPKCGEILEDRVHDIDIINIETDYVDQVTLCECGREVKPKMIDGIQCFEKVDHERWLWATGFYDEVVEQEGAEE